MINAEEEAPKTFLTPISFVLLSVTKAARPSRPKHAIKIAIIENMPAILLVLLSDA